MSDVVNNLNDFIIDLEEVYLKSAMENACAIVQTTAKEKCPKDTGALRRSIDFKTESGKNTVEGRIYSNMEYAPYVEVGTGIYSTKGGGRQDPWVYKGPHGWITTKGNRPQPFLEPAVQTNTTRIIDCFKGLF